MNSSNILRLIFLWMALVLQVKCSITECPRFCSCDVYRDMNRAECSSRRLISAEVDIPNVVQILDLSFNDITTIESKHFQAYKHLRYLNLSHNAINTLELESFSPLRRIIEINLSNNRLQYLDERIFERNRYLQELNLEGNKFLTIAMKPFVKSSSLTILNLRNSQITFINEILFSKLPNLLDLDLSQNLLNNFRSKDFASLTRLKTLNLSENPTRCDKSMQETLQQLKGKGIKICIEKCLGFNDIPLARDERFQKMQMLPNLQELEESEGERKTKPKWHLNFDLEDDLFAEEDNYNDEEKEERKSPITQRNLLTTNEWLRFAPDAVLCEATKFKLCQKYRQCLENLNTAWHDKHQSPRTFSSSEAKFGFFLGVACGLSSAIILLTCVMCTKNFCNNRKKDRLHDVELTIDSEPLDLSPQPLARTPQQLPPQVRRQPRRRAPARPARPMVRYEGPVGENFLSRLFGRPARHQYYRTINQNTATLIRRLSRSNLFNNRLSQHILDRQFSSERREADSAAAATAPRPETPPPCYGDIIVQATGAGK